VEVDAKRKRISLSMRKDDGSQPSAPRGESRGNQPVRGQNDRRSAPSKPESQGAFGAALAEAMKRK
jgi:uncharacterized protein